MQTKNIYNICINVRDFFNLTAFSVREKNQCMEKYIPSRNVTKVIKFCRKSFDMFSVLGSPNSNKIFSV